MAHFFRLVDTPFDGLNYLSSIRQYKLFFLFWTVFVSLLAVWSLQIPVNPVRIPSSAIFLENLFNVILKEK